VYAGVWLRAQETAVTLWALWLRKDFTTDDRLAIFCTCIAYCSLLTFVVVPFHFTHFFQPEFVSTPSYVNPS